MAKAKGTKTVYRTEKSKRRHHKPKFTLPVAVIGSMLPSLMFVVNGYRGTQGYGTGFDGLTHNATEVFTGYQTDTRKWRPMDNMIPRFVGPVLLGTLVHKMANKLGVNRSLKNAGIPWVRI